MEAYPIEIELERIMNLANGFGWVKVKDERIGDEVHLTIKKSVPVPVEVGSEKPEG